ncbi:metalloregulator ArsR/SmtB family transcription factor [Actinotalea sp. K2]|uniref:ArsR/SmtB family transcription factor n=1 Tax=Actinotalea sp. K2 TaxID=2939438 RepID=UPI0020180238|nr:metalloregulator ArsR/SmtB family transcription factor [Actinotalea sp. K2]MCL3859887.1 metalloregulator ArsR/SmtB family transcription factor [Actinotalea sp. K2]
MHALDVLGDPVRRRLVEILAAGDRPAGEVSAVVEAEFGISQPAVARHLRVLRDAGTVTRRADGPRRIYSLDRAVIEDLESVVDRYRSLWAQRLDALDTEIARGVHERPSTTDPGGDRT